MASLELSTLSRNATESLHSIARSHRSKPSDIEPRQTFTVSGTSRTAGASETENAGPTPAQVVKNRIQFAALCLAYFGIGWNDSSSGPLLPRMQTVYQVNFLVVSLVFVCLTIGFISGSLLNVYITDRMSFGRILVLGSVLQMVTYTIQAPAPPFPLFVLSYLISGVGVSLQLAHINGYVSALDGDPSARMGFLHASYGAGGLTAPLVATQFASMRRWSFHYLVSLGIATMNACFLSSVFRFKSRNECRADIALEPIETGTRERSPFGQIMAMKSVHIIAAFILVYVGIEVTIGGWIVTYIIQLRGGGADAGYISSGFWGGIMAGRILLLPLNRLLGERRSVFVYALLSIGLELVIWLVPSLIGGGVAVALVGVLFGPMYPIAVNIAGTVIPRSLFTSSIGWIAAFGQAGSAVLPFITGAMADKVGIQSLQPFLVAMMGVMIVLWALVPKGRRQD